MSTIRKQIWIKATTKNKRPKFDEAAIFVSIRSICFRLLCMGAILIIDGLAKL